VLFGNVHLTVLKLSYFLPFRTRSSCCSLQLRPLPSCAAVASINSFGNHGSATMVLPDHFYCGYYDSYQDTFPTGSEFILCSDGFYGCFPDWHQLWTWLAENAHKLNHKEKRKAILRELHTQLHNKNGDDDISFVWVRPRTPEPPDQKNSDA